MKNAFISTGSTNNSIVFKVGYIDRTLKTRLEEEFRNYYALDIIPILIMNGSKTRKTESEIHEMIHKFQIKVGVFNSKYIGGPSPITISNEFYECNDEIIDIIESHCEKKEYKLIINNIIDESIDNFVAEIRYCQTKLYYSLINLIV